MSIIHPHNGYPEDVLPLEAAIWWRENVDLFLRCLVQAKYRRFYGDDRLSNNLLIYPPKCHITEDEMNGRKSKRIGTVNGSSNGKSAAFQWINIPLTSEDLNLLEHETAGIEQLALAFIQLGVLGLGLSVKFDRVGKSYSVSIYGCDSRNNMRPCGISGAAPDLRDALLVSLFRFNHGLQGSFDDSTNTDSIVQSPRFR